MLRLFAGISVTPGTENPTDCAIAAVSQTLGRVTIAKVPVERFVARGRCKPSAFVESIEVERPLPLPRHQREGAGQGECASAVGDSNVENRQGVRRLDSGKLRPLYGAVDFRGVRRRSCRTSSVLLAKRSFGNRCGHRSCHPRIGSKTVARRKLCRNRPQPANARLRRLATRFRQSHQMATGGCSGAAI